MTGQCVYNVLVRETQDMLSSGASTTALEHDCRGRMAVTVVGSLLNSLLSWLNTASRYRTSKMFQVNE